MPVGIISVEQGNIPRPNALNPKQKCLSAALMSFALTLFDIEVKTKLTRVLRDVIRQRPS